MSRPEILYTNDAVERAARLAGAYLDGTGSTDQSSLLAALDETLADVEGSVTRQRELVGSLAALAGQAVETAMRLALVAAGRDPEDPAHSSPEALREQRESVLAECAAALHELRKAVDRRSGTDRRITPDRRRSHDDSAAARVNRWLHGDRRSGEERRSGADRRESPAAPPDGG